MTKQQNQNNQNKKGKGGGKSKGGGKGGRRRGQGAGNQSHGDVDILNGMLDPWSDMGPQKLPDVNSGKSSVLRLRSRYDMTIGEDSAVAGLYRGGAMFLPRLNAPSYKPVYTATNQLPITGWGADSNGLFAEYSSVISAYHFFRITGWGLRFTSVGAPLNSAGRLIIKTSIDDSPTSDASGPNSTAPRVMEIPIQPGMDVMWRSQPLDNDAWVFVSTSNTGAANLHRWTHCQAFVEGANSSTVVRVEAVMNIEATAFEGSFANRLMTPAADFNPGLLARIANGFAHMPDVIEATASTLRNSPTAMRFATGALQYGAARAHNYYYASTPTITYPA